MSATRPPSLPANGVQPEATESTPARLTSEITGVPTFSGFWKFTNEGLALLATLGLITALLYLFGRAFGSSLLIALKLPEILVPISLNQYYEWGAMPLFFFAVLLATAVVYGLGIRFVWSNAFFVVVALLIDALLTLLTWPLRALLRQLPKLSLPRWLRLPPLQIPASLKRWLHSRLPRYQRWFPITDAESRRLHQLSQYYTAVVTLIIGMFVTGFAFVWMMNQSVLLGRSTAPQITIQPARLFLTQPLSARPGQGTTLADGTAGYVYSNLFLIARGEELFFVFDTLDPATCTPREVLQVSASHIIDAAYGAPQQLSQLCQALSPTAAPTLLPSPSTTMVPIPTP